jgi:hypothetical protein
LILRPGGRILLTYNPAFPRPRDIFIRFTQFVARLGGADWKPEFGDVITKFKGGSAYYHWFSPMAVEREALRAGLRILAHERDQACKVVLAP